MSKVIAQQGEVNTIGSTGNYMIRNENPVFEGRVSLRIILPLKLCPVRVSACCTLIVNPALSLC